MDIDDSKCKTLKISQQKVFINKPKVMNKFVFDFDTQKH